MQAVLPLATVCKIGFKGISDRTEGNFVPGDFMLVEQTGLQGFVPRVEHITEQLGTVEKMHLAHTHHVQHAEQVLAAAQGQQRRGTGTLPGHVFAFRGKRAHLVKLLFWDGQGLCLYAKRLDRGNFRVPEPRGDATTVQLSESEFDEHAFVEMLKQLRAIDTYDSYEGWSEAKIIAPLVLTKERKREIPIVGDPDALKRAGVTPLIDLPEVGTLRVWPTRRSSPSSASSAASR